MRRCIETGSNRAYKKGDLNADNQMQVLWKELRFA